MDSQIHEQAPLSFNNDPDTPPSPKRKKIRSKYAPKACVSCRRSKLKCSGENPCQRCLDNGRRCFYSEDQTAAEALQNLSRPTPLHAPPPQTNGDGPARRSIVPRNDTIERRASDAGVVGFSGESRMGMEARMSRMENMMEALIYECRSMMPHRGSIDRSEAGEEYQTETVLPPLAENHNTNLAPARQQQNGFQHDGRPYTSSNARHSIAAISPTPSRRSISYCDPALGSTVRVGSRTLPFPTLSDYQRYLQFFFAEINPYHPCVNEADFRSRCERMLFSKTILSSDTNLLALNYIIFACTDIMVDSVSPEPSERPAGSQWCMLADELGGKKILSDSVDLTLVQLLIFQSVYLTHADKPNAAYNVIGLACRLCFQLGLHKQSRWTNSAPFTTHMRQRVFWTVYINDRVISLSCGRPHGIRDEEVQLDQPAWLCDKDIIPEQPLPATDISRSANVYLSSMIAWAKLAGGLWEQALTVDASHHDSSQGNESLNWERAAKHYAENTLPALPLIPMDRPPEVRHFRQHVLVFTRLNHLRLIPHRQQMTSLKFDSSTGEFSGVLALETIERLKPHAVDLTSLGSFRFPMTASLGSAILTLATLLIRDPLPLNLGHVRANYTKGFHEAVAILDELAMHFQYARRVRNDLNDAIMAVNNPKQQPKRAVDNPREIFPYTFLDFAQQHGFDKLKTRNGEVSRDSVDGAAVEATMAPDECGLESAYPAGCWGAPWI